MRQTRIYGDRRHRALSRLEEIGIARRSPITQLDDLDMEARALQIEINSLHNLEAPISVLPDEVLAMVFEAGTALERMPQPHCGSLVSHVAQRWRSIALATPSLWNKIYFIKPVGMAVEHPYLEARRQRAAVFLSRCSSFPVDFYIRGLMKNDISEELQLIRDHIGHCRRLCISDVTPAYISMALEYLSCAAAPVLSSISLSVYHYLEEDFALKGPLFPLGAPHLTSAQIDRMELSSIPACLPGLQYVTSLRLTGIIIDDNPFHHDSPYLSFRDALACLRSLNHLELQLDAFSPINTHLPMVLPTLEFLHIHGDTIVVLIRAVHSIRAKSVTTLSLQWCYHRVLLEEGLEPHFPSLEHLILCDIEPEASNLQVVAHSFPGIERLTCKTGTTPHQNPLIFDTHHIITQISRAIGPRGGEGTPTSHHGLCWPKLHTLAVEGSDNGGRLQVTAVHHEISTLREAGHPIRKLRVPKAALGQVDAEAAVDLRDIVEVEEFWLDWPTPFEQGV